MGAIPARLGRYRLLEHIASGGMADVFRAKSVGIAGFEKILAIKLIRPHIAQEPRFIRSFIDEARIAVSLNHRNIVQVFDFGKAEHRLYLAMELIEGIDLKTAFGAAKQAGYDMPLPISCYIISDVGAGLDYAHRKADTEGKPLGIVHCDVSPHNVMLSEEGFIKILDFGVARARFAVTPEERRLRGKPRYMAPEQTRGDIPGPASDAFALGIIAWELFTGLPLFEGDDLAGVLAAVRRADVPPVRELNPDVPDYLSDAISAALSVDSSQRSTVADLSDAAARASRELASVASSRALADWLALVMPGAADLEEGSGDQPQPADSSTSERSDDSASEPPRTRTNIIVASDLASSSNDRAGPAREDASRDEPTRDIDAVETSTSRAPEPSGPAVAAAGSSDAPRPIADALLRERRHVVATCAYIDGADPGLRTEIARLLTELAYKRGAVVQDRSDESVVCVFGLEVAGEDDVASAMHYCIDAGELAREAGPRGLSLRLGTRAGIVAQRRGDAIHVRGSGLDDARALARDAEPGRPLLSGGAGRLATAQFSFRELPVRRHRSRRLRPFELIGPRTFAERARVLTERRGHFVGRERELAELDELLERARAERRRVVIALVGPGGVGKSRLVAEFVARAETARLLAVAASDAGSQAPFSILTELTQAVVGVPPGRGVEARGRLSRRLRELLGKGGLGADEIDECAGTLEQAMELRDGAILRPAQASADFRERVAVAARRMRNAAIIEPTITVIENLQWADAASLDVLRKHGEVESSGAELVVMTTRPRKSLTQFEDAADRILQIEELDRDQRAELIRDRLDKQASPATVELVSARAGGNPLLIEEVCTVIRERGDDQLPASARDILLSRVDVLPRPAKTALQYAAVAGPVVRAPILAELLGPETSSSLATLIDEGLMVSADFAAEGGDVNELRFRHGLLREAVYESLSAGGRQTAHRRLGQLLAARADAGRDERPGEVAYHLELGGELEAAAHFWLRAGELAVAAFDADSARDAYSRALEIAERAGQKGDTDELDELRVQALLGRERAFGLLGDHDAQARDQQALLERIGDSDDARAAEIHWRVAARQARTADYGAALESADRAALAATAANDPKILGEAMLVRGEVLERTGDYVKALNAVTEASQLFHKIGDREAEMRSLVVRGRNCLTRSRYRAARDAYEPVLERLECEPDPFLERMVRNHLAVIDLCVGNFESAMSSAQRSVALCEELGDRARVGDNLSVCGIILCAVGQYDEADDYLRRGLSILEETQSRWSTCDCKLYTGAVATLRGEADRGFELLTESVAEARQLGARYVLANALAELAGALLRRDGPGDTIAAEAAAREAHGIAREAALVGIEILALARHAEATVRLGNTMSAVALSTRAVDLLEAQEGIEGPEEEVLYTHCQLLRRTGDERAEIYLERARRSLDSKLERMSDPGWRESFERVAVNAAILLES